MPGLKSKSKTNSISKSKLKPKIKRPADGNWPSKKRVNNMQRKPAV